MPEDASAPRVSRLAIEQNHGFSRGSVVRFNGENWVLGLAGDAGLGMVGTIRDSSTFEFVQLGFLDGLNSYEFLAGTTYYVSAIVPGELTVGSTATPLFNAYTATTGFVITASAAGSATGGAAGVTSGELAQAIATEMARANGAYATVTHNHDTQYVTYHDAVVDIDEGTIVFDVDTLAQVVNIDI